MWRIKKDKIRLEWDREKKNYIKICYAHPHNITTSENRYYLLFNENIVYTFDNVQRHKTQFITFKITTSPRAEEKAATFCFTFEKK